MTTSSDDLVPDELWVLVEPLLPAPPRPPYGGRRRTISDRASLPRSCTWPAPPPRGGCCPPGSWAAARRRPAGAALPSGPTPAWFDQLHIEVLDGLGEQGRLDWSRASVDTMSMRAKRGGITWA